jgi:hypothetical protein
MQQYKDFSYTQFVLSLEFREGYSLFKKCLDRLDYTNQDRAWDLYLLAIQGEFKGSFDDYLKQMQINNYDKEKRDKEEKRILDKYNNFDESKIALKRVI